MPLRETPVYHNLDWSWSWRGITLAGLLVGVASGPVFFLTYAALTDTFQWDVTVVLSAVCAASVAALQYRQPPRTLRETCQRLSRPRHFSPFVPAPDHPPFPFSRDELG